MLKYLIKNPIHLRLEQSTPIYSPIKLKSNTSCRTYKIKIMGLDFKKYYIEKRRKFGLQKPIKAVSH
jgi:hypothetical protein